MYRHWILTGTLFLILTSLACASPVQSQRYRWDSVKVVAGGYVPGIIFNQSEKDLIYARTDMGGAYRWDSKPGRWIPLMDCFSRDEWNLLGCDSIATDPVDVDRVYIAAGIYTNEWTNMNGYMLRSADRGATWKRTEMPFKMGGNMPGRGMGERMAIDPNRNSVIYFGARSGNGLWKSVDYGETWSRVSSFTATGNYADAWSKDPTGPVWVVFDPRSGKKGEGSRTIYVGVADTGTAIWRSTDAGATWEPLPGQPRDGFLPYHGILASDGTLYVSYSNTCGPYDGSKGDVWKCDTATLAWKRISPIPSGAANCISGYGGLAVDPTNPKIVMVADQRWWPDVQIYRSTDGGSSWGQSWELGPWPTRTNFYEHDISAAPWLDWGKTPAEPEVSPKLGWMVGDLDIDPFNPDRLLYSTGACVYEYSKLRELDRHRKRARLSVFSDGIEETFCSALACIPGGAPLLSGIADICGFCHEDITKVPEKMMQNPVFSKTSSIDWAAAKPSFVVRVGTCEKGHENPPPCIAFSNDYGRTWSPGTDIPGFPKNGNIGGGMVAVARDASVLVWAPSLDTAPHWSADYGKTWNRVEGLPARAQVVCDRMDANRFYAVSDGLFYKSVDGGRHFTKASDHFFMTPGGGASIAAAPNQAGKLWILASKDRGARAGYQDPAFLGLWLSTDYGEHFTRVAGVADIDTMGFGCPAPGSAIPAIYAMMSYAGISGFFRSDDGGSTWIHINDAAHQYGSANASIAGDARIYGRVYIGTNGRGIIVGDIDTGAVLP